MLPPQIVFGYHGCDESIVTAVLNGEPLKPSVNDYDWLGHGIYFWETSVARAQHWAHEMSILNSSRIKKPAVIGAIIHLGYCLNLTDPDSSKLVEFAYQNYLEECHATGVSPLTNKGTESKARFLDCAVINHLHSLGEKSGDTPYDTVRGFFNEGKPVYPTAGLRTLDHVQVCVRNPQAILGFFRPNAARI